MIWPFDKKNNPPDKVVPVRFPPRASEPKRTWQLLQVEPALTCNLACVMFPWHGESGRSDGSGLMDQEGWAAMRPWLRQAEMVRVLNRSRFEASFIKLEAAFQEAKDAMPPAGGAGRVCHFLYGV